MSDELAGIAQRVAPYLDKGSDQPLYRQLADRVWLDVVTGALEVGERLPTVRQLAIDLGVHPNTVQRAYQELESLGVLAVRPGGTFIALGSTDTSTLERQAQLERLCRGLMVQATSFGFTVHELIDTLRELSGPPTNRSEGERS